jgi:hypothetical protein
VTVVSVVQVLIAASFRGSGDIPNDFRGRVAGRRRQG